MSGISTHQMLSDIIIFSKYAKYLPEHNRREAWQEAVRRVVGMHQAKFPELAEDLEAIEHEILQKNLLPSMRSMQFAGKPIELNNTRGYNCCYLPVDHYRAFDEAMFLLLGGTGVGYSVQRRHTEKLPPIQKSTKTRRFLIGDSIEGWATSIKVLVRSFFEGRPEPLFDYSDIREKGNRLVTSGGKAPGPEPLRIAHVKIAAIFHNKKDGEKLEPIECYDIMCHIADAVLAGGIRRAAEIVGFDADDDAMLTSKVGQWWELNPQRGRANNGAIIYRDDPLAEKKFNRIMQISEASLAGEPSVIWSNDPEYFFNPCVEASLRQHTFCNLVEINFDSISSQEELERVSSMGGILGTIQASYTDFHYLRPIWKEATEKDALLGVSMTGLAKSHNFDLEAAAKKTVEANKLIAKKIGINQAARVTCVKPAGTTSLVLGTSSGIHAWYAPYYIRRMRLAKNEVIYKYLNSVMPELMEDEFFASQSQAVFSLPIKAPDGAITREEDVISFLERVKHVHTSWVKPGHNRGSNTHNVSATISVKDHEWGRVRDWMWNNKESYAGLSMLPYDGGSYKQTPFEEITEEQYKEMLKLVRPINLLSILEEEDDTDLQGELACAGGACELK